MLLNPTIRSRRAQRVVFSIRIVEKLQGEYLHVLHEQLPSPQIPGSSTVDEDRCFPCKVKFALCIPTLNAGTSAVALLDAIKSQSLQPDAFLVIDSSSSDASTDIFRDVGAEVRTIQREAFNHGGTRQLGVAILSNVDVIVFLTQDAVPAKLDAFEHLIACFEDQKVSAAFGRQLPRMGAGPIEAHARYFNYPEFSRVNTWDDRNVLGIKTVFISNSFAAYRRADLIDVGGFPDHLIMGEDTYVAAKLLQTGKKVAYCAEATVFHSHDYGLMEEFRRYFDTGVLHAREAWIRAKYGGPGGEGWRFLKSEVRYVFRLNPFLLPSLLIRNALKLAGFKLGLQERRLPLWMKRRFSMFRPYWGA